MVIFPDHNIGYQHAFKTAGTTVSEFLIGLLGPAVIHPYGPRLGEIIVEEDNPVHGPLSFKKMILKEIIERETLYSDYRIEFEELSILATIRNPFIKAVSAYEFIKANQEGLEGVLPETKISEVNDYDFKTWYLNNITFQGQSNKLLIDGVLPDNVVLAKVENLELEVKGFLSLHNVYTKKELPRHNTTKIFKPYMEYYDQELINVVLEAEDWLISNHYPELLNLSI